MPAWAFFFPLTQWVAVKYKLVIFDFDGTLADSLHWFIGAMNQVAERHGLKQITPSDYQMLRGADVGQIMRHLGVTRWKTPLIAKELRQMMQSDIHKIRLFKGVDAALEQLARNGVALGLVTSNAKANVEKVLGPGLMKSIAHQECGVSIFGKASKLKRVLRASGVPRPQALYVGDEMRDGEAARKAAIPFGAVTWGYSSPEALAGLKPAELFQNVSELARM